MWLASVTGLATTPLPVRLDVVAVDAASRAHAPQLHAWLRAALEKEGVVFTSLTSPASIEGEPAQLLIVELRENQWRVWTAAEPDAVVAIDASDYAVASLEALHQASLLLEERASSTLDGPATESAAFAAGAPIDTKSNAPSTAPASSGPKLTLPTDLGLEGSESDLSGSPRPWWVDVNLGFAVSERANFVLGLDGAMFQTPNWGGIVNLGVHHVSDFSSFDQSWELSIWDYRVSAGPMFSVPLTEKLRFNTALEVGLTIHTYDFTGEGWDARVNALANVPLAFSYQGRDWRFGLTANVTLNSATFSHQVFGMPVWQTEQLNAAFMASFGRRVW
jgi:hypothetical protein